jgi:hypothetical protein
LAGGILAGWVAWLAWRPVKSPTDMARRMLLAVAGLFLLSPTQFPWYGLWMLPLLALTPKFSLLLLMVLLSLYHARYTFDARDNVAVFDNWLVWLEYVPVWVILVWEGMKGPGNSNSHSGHSPPEGGTRTARKWPHPRWCTGFSRSSRPGGRP